MTRIWFLLPGLLFFISVSLFASGQTPHPANDADLARSLKKVKERSISYLLGGEGTGKYRRQATAALDEWVGREMSSPYDPLVWEEAAALRMNVRIQSLTADIERLATAFVAEGSRYQKDQKLRQRIVDGIENVLQYFQPNGPRPGNWHPWLIVIPRHLGATALLMESDLPPDLLSRIKTTLRSELSPRLILTGTNASWEARNHIYLALLDGDVDRLQRAADYVFQFVRYGPDQGIREDFCYLFHGFIPYAGAYGSGFAQTVAEFIYTFDDTPWALSPFHRDIIRNLLLEHTRWFLADGHIDLHIRGRTFKKSKGNWDSILEAIVVLAQTTDPKRKELAATAAAMLHAKPEMRAELTCAGFADMLSMEKGALPTGFRYWPTGEIGVFRQPSYHIGFRQFSSRIEDYEYLMRADGGEGGEGANLPYGFTNILRNDGKGSWYQSDKPGMFPSLDLEHLTGTTARIGANPENPLFVNDPSGRTMSTTGFSLNFGKSPFAGGVGYQDGGVAGFILQPVYGGMIARKSLHFFPNGYWALGSAIASIDKKENDKPVHTTVLQWPSAAKLPVIMVNNRHERISDNETRFLKKTKWLWIEGENVAVVFNDPTDVFVRVKDSIVMVWIDHGNAPTNGSYAYALLPDATLETAKAFVKEMPFRPVRHDDRVHAVTDREGKKQSLVFFDADSCLGIKSDAPAIVQRDHETDGGIVTVQDPLHQKRTFNLSFDKLTGAITTKDDALKVAQRSDGSAQVGVNSVLGRIYRFGYGNAGTSAEPAPRQDLDLSSYQDFRVEAQSDASKTILTVYLPDHAVESGYRLSVHYVKSQRLYDFTDADIIDRPARNVVRYTWHRTGNTIGPPVFTEYLKLTHGKFSVLLVTELITATAPFTVPGL